MLQEGVGQLDPCPPERLRKNLMIELCLPFVACFVDGVELEWRGELLVKEEGEKRNPDRVVGAGDACRGGRVPQDKSSGRRGPLIQRRRAA